MLVITGPGRSGTSVLSQFCASMGYCPGGEWCEEISAGLENPRVVNINNALYREARTSGCVERALEVHRDEMLSLDFAVVKDPRFTYHPAILRAWSFVRPDLKVLLTYRTPQDSIVVRQYIEFADIDSRRCLFSRLGRYSSARTPSAIWHAARDDR